MPVACLANVHTTSIGPQQSQCLWTIATSAAASVAEYNHVIAKHKDRVNHLQHACSHALVYALAHCQHRPWAKQPARLCTSKGTAADATWKETGSQGAHVLQACTAAQNLAALLSLHINRIQLAKRSETA